MNFSSSEAELKRNSDLCADLYACMHGYIGGKRGHVTFSSRILSEGLMNITAADVDIMAAGKFGGEGIMIDDDSQVNIMGDGVAEGQRGHVKFTSPTKETAAAGVPPKAENVIRVCTL